MRGTGSYKPFDLHMALISATTIKPPPALITPQAKAVMSALNNGSATPAALFVGGCIRNALSAHTIDDIDIATIHPPEEVTKRLTAAGIKAIPTGIEHGTITGVMEGKPFEITTLRRDVSTDGRRAVVAFTTDWAEDAQRRDFTMNTLLADGEGQIYDPTGQGLADLKAGRVTFVGKPDQRVAEDYLRILRFFRFHARYGSGHPDSAGLSACKKAADKIGTLSRERITQEFLKILSHDNAHETLKIMFGNNVLPDLAHASYNPETLNLLCTQQKQHDTPNLMARLAVLCGFKSSHINVLEKYLLFSREQSKMLNLLLTIVPGKKEINDKAMKAFIYRHGQDAAIQSVLLFYAQNNQPAGDFFNTVKDWVAPNLPLTGDDVMATGIAAGPQIGKILSGVESWWIENNFTPDHDDCIKKMKKLIAGDK